MNIVMKWSTISGTHLVLLCLFAAPILADAATTSSTDSTTTSPICNDSEGCLRESVECLKECGCDGIYKFDKSKGECVIDFEYLKERTRANNLMQAENDNIEEDGMAKKIRESTEKVFKGIICCAIFFIIVCSICVISVCVFCCRIHYSDQQLKNEVKALAGKLNVDYKQKESMRKQPRHQKEESCNVIVEDANVICV